LQNGDRYLGTVVGLNAETLTLRSEVLGTVILPRGKVSRILLEPGPPARPAAPPASTSAAAASTNAPPGRLPAAPTLTAGTNDLERVQAQLLAGATPEARAKFRDLALGYLTGKLSVDDIRAEARTAVGQLKALKAELGDEADASFDTYLSILENFLGETKPAAPAPAATNSAPPKAGAGPP
jgi:hypothetical protein